VNERDPTINGSLISPIDPEDFIENIGGRPEHRLQIENVATEARNFFEVLQRTRYFAEHAVGVRAESWIGHGLVSPAFAQKQKNLAWLERQKIAYLDVNR
jgi:hypothetical protein